MFGTAWSERFATVNFILQPLLLFAVVIVVSTFHGSRLIIFKYSADHFLIQLFSQPFIRPHDVIGVVILLVQVMNHFRIFLFPQPEVIVTPGVSVN